MEIKKEQQSTTIEHTKDTIISAEEKRKKDRFKYSFNKLGQGHIQILANDEFVNGLVDYFCGTPSENLIETKNIIVHLGEGAVVEDRTLRERALAVLSPAAVFYVGQKETEGIIILVNVFYNWLEYETELLPGFAIIGKRVEEIMEWLLKNSLWNEAEKMFLLLSRIQSGSLAKCTAIKSLISKTIERLSSKRSIEELTDHYLLNNGQQQEAIQNILVAMGEKAAIYQMNRLIQSRSRKERLLLLDLIPAFGDRVIPILVDCQEQNPPWAIVRNIVYIISEIGVNKHYPIVEQYLHHPDVRVQHEMISCIMKLDGLEVKQRLLEALGIVNTRLKPHVIRLLIEKNAGDSEFLQALCDLAQKSNTMPVHSNSELLNALIYGLKAFSCSQSLEMLNKMYAQYQKRNGTEQILLNINEARKVVEPKIRHSLLAMDGIQEVVSFETDPLMTLPARGKVRKIEEQVKSLIASGNTRQAEQLIYAEAVAAAQVKDFAAAEILRDRLLEINPMLLSEVVQLGQQIEAQKNRSISSHHIEIWNELYEEMTTEEFNALYYALRQENYRKDEVIVNIGETDTNLYFLNSGSINLSCISGGVEVFLKKMQPGDVLGSEQFFSPSVWTISLKALSEVQVQVLGRKALEEIAGDHPGIENTLQVYCSKYVQIPELLKMSGDDRREYPRYSGRLLVRSILFDNFGMKGKRSFKGELIDVSQGGLAFTVKITNKKNAELLLGRQIVTVIALDDKEFPQCSGVIVGVSIQDPVLQDYSVHVKLSRPISDDVFKQIVFQVG